MNLKEVVGEETLSIVADRVYRMYCHGVDEGNGGVDALDIIAFLRSGDDNVPDDYDPDDAEWKCETDEVIVNQYTAGGTA